MNDYSKYKFKNLKPGRLRGILHRQRHVETIVSEKVPLRKRRKPLVKT